MTINEAVTNFQQAVHDLCLLLIDILESFIGRVSRWGSEDDVDAIMMPVTETQFKNDLADEFRTALIAELKRRRLKVREVKVQNFANQNLDISIYKGDEIFPFFSYLSINHLIIRLHGRNGFEALRFEDYIRSFAERYQRDTQ